MEAYRNREYASRSHRDADRNCSVWIPAVVHVVSIISVIYVDVVVIVPIVRPIFGPRVEERYPVPLVLEARISAINHEGASGDPKPMLRSKIAAIAILRNPVAVIPATLTPGAVV